MKSNSPDEAGQKTLYVDGEMCLFKPLSLSQSNVMVSAGTL